VQVVLGVKDSKELLKFSQKLDESGMMHRVWIEQVHTSVLFTSTLYNIQKLTRLLAKTSPAAQSSFFLCAA
jgi:hypothetical protein